jgi:hypothetical protein
MDAGTDGILSWGRWTGAIIANSSPVTLLPTQGLHYVTGIPTSAASMPTNGVFTYNLIQNGGTIGATSPTFANGLAPAGVLNSATLVGDFGQRTVNIDLSLTAGGTTLATSTPAAGTFSGTPTFNATGTLFPNGAGTVSCSGGCNLQVQGFFSGAGATHAGLAYNVTGVFSTATGSTSIVGAAALAR